MLDDRVGSLENLSNEKLIRLLRGASDRADDSSYASGLREQLVKRNIGLVKSIASLFLNSGEQLNDLVQAGYIGLLNAVSNFDLARGICFSTYASYLIKGEIRHYIRDKHSTVRIPQWAQAMGQRLKEVEEDFFQENGRPPRIAELAMRMNLTQEQVIEVLKGRNAMHYVSIDQQRRSEDPRPPVPRIDTMYRQELNPSSDIQIRIAIAIERLEEIQQQVLRGLFYHGKTQSEIGKELNISQRQVSRMKKEALQKLKDGVFREDKVADA
jgi:RNA polymerase sigma-B factor